MQLRSTLHLGVIAIEKGAFRPRLDEGHQVYLLYIDIN